MPLLARPPLQVESLRFDRRGNLLATYNSGVRCAARGAGRLGSPPHARAQRYSML